MKRKIKPYKLKDLYKEELASSKEYRKLGLHDLAKDEFGHYKKLKKMYASAKKRK